MDIYLYIYIFVILIFEILADEFCQPNLDGVEECEGNINKDPEVQNFWLRQELREAPCLFICLSVGHKVF